MSENQTIRQMREDARELAQERVERGIDDALDFYQAALAVGASPGQADDIATELNERVMRAAGVI